VRRERWVKLEPAIRIERTTCGLRRPDIKTVDRDEQAKNPRIGHHPLKQNPLPLLPDVALSVTQLQLNGHTFGHTLSYHLSASPSDQSTTIQGVSLRRVSHPVPWVRPTTRLPEYLPEVLEGAFSVVGTRVRGKESVVPFD